MFGFKKKDDDNDSRKDEDYEEIMQRLKVLCEEIKEEELQEKLMFKEFVKSTFKENNLIVAMIIVFDAWLKRKIGNNPFLFY